MLRCRVERFESKVKLSIDIAIAIAIKRKQVIYEWKWTNFFLRFQMDSLCSNVQLAQYFTEYNGRLAALMAIMIIHHSKCDNKNEKKHFNNVALNGYLLLVFDDKYD